MKRRGLITLVLLPVVVFIGLALYGDFSDLLGQISAFPVQYWFMALGLALGNYVVRFARWHYYLRLLGIKIGTGASAVVFMSGLGMVMTPGRVGELAKSYYLKEKLDVPVARSSAAVIAERVTDLVAVLMLSLWGLALIPFGWVVALAVIGVFGVFMLLVVSPWGSDRLLRLPLPRRWRPFLTTSRDAFQQVFSLKPLMVAVLLGMVAWLMEGCALWLVLQGLDATGSLGQAVSIYAVATMLGAITMLPGGLVGTEGGMIALLQQIDLSKTQASTATVIIRVCTLWFAVAIGILALLYLRVYKPKKTGSEDGPIAFSPETPGQTG